MRTSQKLEWFEHESFWKDFYAYMFHPQRMALAVDEAAQVLELTRPKGKDILDLCCGPGRFSVELARRKYRVTGVDRTRYLLNKARRRARDAGVAVEWVLKDMREFVRPGSFDLALNMFASFGYFDNPNEDLLVLKNIFTSLKPGGKLVIDTLGKERLAKVFLQTVSSDEPDGSIIVQRHEAIDGWTRIKNEWIIIKNNRSKHYHFVLRIYSGQELKERLLQAGFGKVQVYGSFRGDPYDHNAQRLVAVAIRTR